jgi:UDP-N-acetylglucosamine:LPS N-acetylglucosamine transferase
VADADATAEVLGPTFEAWAADPGDLRRRATAAEAVGRPHAAEELAAWVLQLAGERRG